MSGDCTNLFFRMYKTIIPDLFLNSKLSDAQVRIKLQDGEEMSLPGHVTVLKAASKVFEVMLDNTKFKEGKTGVVEIQVPGDKDLAINFFRFMYTKKLDECDIDQYITLIKVSHMYEIIELALLCETRVLQKLTPYSVCRIYRSLYKYVTQRFIVSCQEFMLSSAFIIFAKDLHLLLDEGTMKMLLESATLNTPNEDSVLQALLRWGYIKSTLSGSFEHETKKHISGLLPLIKWHLVQDVEGSEEISNLIAEFKIDTDGSSTGDRKRSEKPSLNTLVDVWNISSSGISSVPSCFTVAGEHDLITFTVNADILLVGLALDIVLYAKYDWKQQVSLAVDKVNVPTDSVFSKVIQRSSGHTIANNYSCYVRRVELEFVKPIQLQLTKLHEIKMSVKEASNVVLPETTSECFPHLCSKGVMFYVPQKKVLGLKKLFYFLE